MNTTCLSVLILSAFFASPTLAFAKSPAQTVNNPNAELIQRLEAQAQLDAYKEKFWSQEPVTQQDYRVQEREDRQVADKLAAGMPVYQAEVDQALAHVPTDY